MYTECRIRTAVTDIQLLYRILNKTCFLMNVTCFKDLQLFQQSSAADVLTICHRHMRETNSQMLLHLSAAGILTARLGRSLMGVQLHLFLIYQLPCINACFKRVCTHHPTTSKKCLKPVYMYPPKANFKHPFLPEINKLHLLKGCKSTPSHFIIGDRKVEAGKELRRPPGPIFCVKPSLRLGFPGTVK